MYVMRTCAYVGEINLGYDLPGETETRALMNNNADNYNLFGPAT